MARPPESPWLTYCESRFWWKSPVTETPSEDAAGGARAAPSLQIFFYAGACFAFQFHVLFKHLAFIFGCHLSPSSHAGVN